LHLPLVGCLVLQCLLAKEHGVPLLL
jgi:hypothetical protein